MSMMLIVLFLLLLLLETLLIMTFHWPCTPVSISKGLAKFECWEAICTVGLKWHRTKFVTSSVIFGCRDRAEMFLA